MTVLYPTHNRLEYNQLTLPVILEAARGRKVIIIDDMSTDGTWEWLRAYPLPLNASLIQKQIGNSRDQWMEGLQDDLVANFCNDVFIHSGSLDRIEGQLKDLPHIFGISPVRGSWPHVGTPDLVSFDFNGCGVYRTTMFEKYGSISESSMPNEKRFFGFTAYQEHICREEGRQCFMRDGGHVMTELDFSPFSRVKEYTELGYSRNLT